MVSVLPPSSWMPNKAFNSALFSKIRRASPVTVTRFARYTLPCTTYQPFVVSLQALSSSVTTVAVTVCVVPVSSR